MGNFLKVNCILHFGSISKEDEFFNNFYNNNLYKYFNCDAEDSFLACETVHLGPVDVEQKYSAFPGVYLYTLYFDMANIKDIKGLKRYILRRLIMEVPSLFLLKHVMM